MSEPIKKVIPSKIQQELDKNTRNLKQPGLGDKKLEIIYPYIEDFLKLIETSEITSISKNPFFQWLNNHPCIVAAYETMSQAGLISRAKELLAQHQTTLLCNHFSKIA
jgi:hypothetical protein